MVDRPNEPARLKKKAAPSSNAAVAQKSVPAPTTAPVAKGGASTKSSGRARPPRADAKSPRTAVPPADGKPGGAQGLLRAGLKALGNVRNDVAKRQANVIESLLGIGSGDPSHAVAPADKAATHRGFPGLDSFGIRKFEDVFDQRVASALERLGMPGASEIRALRDEVQQLREQLKPPARAKPAPRKR